MDARILLCPLCIPLLAAPALAGPAAVLLTDVVSFSVHAYDQDNVALINPLFGAACDAVRRVALDVTVQRNDATERLRTKVFIRSTMAGAEGG